MKEKIIFWRFIPLMSSVTFWLFCIFLYLMLSIIFDMIGAGFQAYITVSYIVTIAAIITVKFTIEGIIKADKAWKLLAVLATLMVLPILTFCLYFAILSIS